MLERLGFNVTKIRWRLYQRERKRSQERRLLPDSLRWIEYQHKICFHCGAIVPREDRRCPQCARWTPGPIAYRALRLAGLMYPTNSPIISSSFLGAILIFFALGVMLEGLGAIWSPSNELVIRLGAFIDGGPYAWQASPWRALTFALVHGGVLHLLFNGFALYQVGPVIEEAIGARRTLVLITATQIASAAATVLWYSTIQGGYAFTVGASGFLCGLVGFGAGYCHSQGPAGHFQRNFFLQWAMYVLVIGWALGANNAAHAGGFFAGLPLGVVLQRQGPGSFRQQSLWNALFGISLAMWTLSVGALIYSAIQPQ